MLSILELQCLSWMIENIKVRISCAKPLQATVITVSPGIRMQMSCIQKDTSATLQLAPCGPLMALDGLHDLTCLPSVSAVQCSRERESDQIRSDQPLCTQSISGFNNSPEPLSVLRAAAGKALSSTPILRDGTKLLNGAAWSGIQT